MILKNPLDKDLTIQYNGIHYTIPANEQISIPDDVATYWKEKVHTFLIHVVEEILSKVPFVKLENPVVSQDAAFPEAKNKTK